MFREHFADLSIIITSTLTGVSNALYAEAIIPFEIYNHILTTTGESNFLKSTKLVNELLNQIRASQNSRQHLVKICCVLRSQDCQELREIATSILQSSGK